MKTSLLLPLSCLLFAQTALATDTPSALAEMMRDAFTKSDSSALVNHKAFIVITGDIPIGRSRAEDLDGFSEPVPRLYTVASVKVLAEKEARSIEAKGYAKGEHEGYIAVDFTRREDSDPKAQITAFRRYYPYEKTESGWHLTSGK